MKSTKFAIFILSFAVLGFSVLLFSNLTIAQKPGSCQVDGQTYCGDQSPDECYCDSASVTDQYNDYCEDIDTVCGIAKPVKDSIQSYPYPYPYPAQYPPSSASSGLPEYCEKFGSPSDNYCDDSPENCASGYVEDASAPECKECTTGKWSSCNKAGSTPTPPPVDKTSCSERTACAECVKVNTFSTEGAEVSCGWDKTAQLCKGGTSTESYDGVYGADKWAWKSSLCLAISINKESQKTQVSTSKLLYKEGDKLIISGKIPGSTTFTVSIYNPEREVVAIDQGTSSSDGTYLKELLTVGNPGTKMGMIGRYNVKIAYGENKYYNTTFDIVPADKSVSTQKIYTGVKSLITKLELDEPIKVVAADDNTEYLVTLLIKDSVPTIRVESATSTEISGLPQDRALPLLSDNFGSIAIVDDNIDPAITKALIIVVPAHNTLGIWADAIIVPI